MRVLVFGGRDFRDKNRLWTALDELHSTLPITEIINGGAPGADTLAARWAEDRLVSCTTYHAEWARHGRSAGPRRNEEMAATNPDLGVQCPGGRGTADMRMRLDGRQIEVMEI